MGFTVQQLRPATGLARFTMRRNNLLRAILLILAAFAAGVLLPGYSMGEDTEIAARVNGEPITQAQLDRMAANPLTLNHARQEFGVEEPDRKELERLALQKLIQLRLLVQEARRRAITVSQDELDQAVADLRKQFDDLASFGKWVREQGLTDPELFESVRADMLASRAMAALAADVQVSEKQIREYYDTHQDDLVIGTEVRLRIIAVPEKKEADGILNDLKQGKNFAQLAYQRSHGKLAAQGGDTGWVDFNTLPSPLQETVAKLQVGDIAGPLEKAENEYLLVGLQDKRPLQAKNLKHAYPEIERRLLVNRKQKAVKEWLDEQKNKADIEVLL